MENKEELASFGEAMEYIADGGKAMRKYWHSPLRLIKTYYGYRIGFLDSMDYNIEKEDVKTKDWILI